MLRSILAGALLCALPAFAQFQEAIEVTATRIAEDVEVVPASITVIDGDQLRARNVTDLAGAMALVAGVSAAGGSDAGPNAGVPEMWGLREVDAFLLVVDGVPWGGAFNPDLPTVDLTGVERIEIVRGSAPVMYGATSFVGVIHVIHREPGTPGDVRVSAGSHGSGSLAASVPISQTPDRAQSIIASVERRGSRDDDSGFDRAHGLYRLKHGNLRLDADLSLVRQDPSSPHPRQGPVLSPLVPLDANHNPHGARIDEDRIQVSGSWTDDRSTVMLAVTRSELDILRGFLSAINEASPNATGFAQDRTVTDLYFDAHTVRQLQPHLRAIFGLDHLYGNATAENELFDYFAPLAGGSTSSIAPDEENRLHDRRNFSGAYGAFEWTPQPRLRFDLGMRLNHTRESRTGSDEDGSEEDSRSLTRLGGSVGVNYLVMKTAEGSLAVFADYRNTYKPAAIDFGPEAEGEILEVETADSWEVGLKGTAMENRLRWQASGFLMHFSNLVVPTVRNGLPTLENAGNERFTGFETEADWRLSDVVDLQLAYSYHDARFTDYVRAFDGVLTQLRGRRFEMSPLHMAGAGLTYFAPNGWNGNVVMNYAGERYLTKRNTARAEPYTIWSAGIGHALGRGELRLDGRNLTDERPPVAESELGDAQYYRLAARSLELSYRMKL